MLIVSGVLGSEGVLGVRVAAAVVDHGAQALVVMEMGVHLLITASPSTAPAAAHRPLTPLLLLLLLLLVMVLLLLLLLLLFL